MKATTDIPQLKKTMTDNITSIYASILASSKTLGENVYSFGEIFADSPAGMKKLFDKNEKNFNKYVGPFVDDLIITQSKQFGYNPEEVKKQLTTKTEQTTTTKAETKPPTTETTTKPTTTPTTTETPVAQQNAGYLTNPNDNKIFEEVDPDPAAAKKQADQFQKLKDSMIKWFDFAVYKKMNETLKENAKTNKTEGGALEDKIKNMKSTKNTDSVNKVIDAITQLDMGKLKQVRDIVGLNKDSAPL
jgi:hypothetical protein